MVTQEVCVHHTSSIKIADLCRTLVEAAFEVNSAVTKNERGETIAQLEYPTNGHRWFEVAADFLRQPLQAPTTPRSSLYLQAAGSRLRKKHLENCDACRAEELVELEKYSKSPGSYAQQGGFLKKSPYEHLHDEDSLREKSRADGTVQTNSNSPRRPYKLKTHADSSSRNRQHPQLSPSSGLSITPNGMISSDQSNIRTPTGKREETFLVLAIGGMTCASCTSAIKEALRELDYVETVDVDLMTNSATIRFAGPSNLTETILDTVQDIGYDASVTTCNSVSSSDITKMGLRPASLEYRATLSVSGMTCVSCSNAITEGLLELPFVQNVNISLMANSGTVTYTGQEHLDEIVQKVDDLGYDCSVNDGEAISSSTKYDGQSSKSLQRRVTLKVNGIFCEHCPLRILEALNSKFSERVRIEKIPSLKDPTLSIVYEPCLPTFTIRDIVSTINSVNESFETLVYHPPSVEDRSKAMQVYERKRIFRRLVLSFVIAMPTLLIGVIWMDLVPSSNHIRSFFQKSVWAGNVTRAEWSLFILATPVMFFAADTFHIRAVKEIRALWRKGTKVPILRRFYRFGSMNLLVSAGTSVAYLASLALLIIGATTAGGAPNDTTYFDTVVFLTFFILFGRYLEAYSKSKTGDAVGMLGKLRPQEALLTTSLVSEKEDPVTEQELVSTARTRKISADMLEVGDVVIVARGSSPPADGIILAGFAQFDESSLTGESLSVKKGPGEKVFVGTINTGNSITVEVTEIGGSSMLDQIVSVVREGQTKRAPIEKIADLLTGYFVPVITGLAITTFLVWFSLGQSGRLSSRYLDGQAGGWAFWSLEFAIAVFVVACPCGLGLAAPTALFVGGGLAARHGILVRGGGEAFQGAGNLDAIVFDKTGTLTEGGDLRVTDHEILAKGEDSEIAWAISRALEDQSSHPIAQAIAALASRQQSTKISTNVITEEPGQGIRGTFTTQATIDGKIIVYEGALGSEHFISSFEPTILTQNCFVSQMLSLWKSQSKSIAILATRHLRHATSHEEPSSTPWKLAALFATSDPIRPSALPTIQNLQARGLGIYMLTGDNAQTAASVASSLDIPIANVFAGVLPTEKASKIKWLQEHAPRRHASSSSSWTRFLPFREQKIEQLGQQHRAKIAFVGDGINDAPALTTANLSISLSTGSPIALSASSFILLSPSLFTVPILLDLSTRVFRRIKFNFTWALVYNLVLVPLAAGVLFKVRSDGWRLGPVWASAAMAGSSVSVVCCSLLLRWEGSWRFWKHEEQDLAQEE